MDHVIEGPDGHRHRLRGRAATSGASRSSPTCKQGETLRIVKFLAYGWSAQRSLPAVRDQVEAALFEARHTGWEGLLRAQREVLDDFWSRTDVELDGDEEIQQAVRFGIFHTLQAGARAERRAIPAKGLTGPGYDGHAFWDTETFVLPLLTYSVPQAAAAALHWRHSILPLARERARTLEPRRRGAAVAHDRRRGVLGLLARGHSRVPRVRRRGGRRHPLRRGHRGPRVRARRRTRAAGRDRAPVAVAGPPRPARRLPHRRRHRAGRVQRDRGQQRLHEPDGGAEPARRGGGGRAPSRARARAGRGGRRAARLACTRPTRSASPTTSSSRCTRSRRTSRATRSGTSRPPADRYPLLLHFPYFQLYRTQVVKQPDLVLAMHLRGDAFTPEEKLRNFDYYERRTVHDSSLSACTEAVMAAEVGYVELAYDYLAEAALVDLDDTKHNTRDGVHIASLAGAWMACVAGLGGHARLRRAAQLRAAPAGGPDPAAVPHLLPRPPHRGGGDRRAGHLRAVGRRPDRAAPPRRALHARAGTPVTLPSPPRRTASRRRRHRAAGPGARSRKRRPRSQAGGREGAPVAPPSPPGRDRYPDRA